MYVYTLNEGALTLTDKEYFIFGRRNSGFFDIRDLQGAKVNKGSINCKKIRFVSTSNAYLTEKRLTGSA